MTDNLDNSVLEHLRALRAGQDCIETGLKEVKQRLTALNQIKWTPLSRPIFTKNKEKIFNHILKNTPRMEFDNPNFGEAVDGYKTQNIESAQGEAQGLIHNHSCKHFHTLLSSIIVQQKY